MGLQLLIKLCCQGKRKGGRGKDQIEFQGSNWVQGRCWRDKDVSFGSRCTGLPRKHRKSCLTLNWCIVYPPCGAVTFQRAARLKAAAHQLRTGTDPMWEGLHTNDTTDCCTWLKPRMRAKEFNETQNVLGAWEGSVCHSPKPNTIVLLAKEVMAKNKSTSLCQELLGHHSSVHALPKQHQGQPVLLLNQTQILLKAAHFYRNGEEHCSPVSTSRVWDFLWTRYRIEPERLQQLPCT